MTVPTSIEIGTPLFSIFQSRGSDESTYRVAVFVTHDEKAANAYVERQNAIYESMRAKREQAHCVAAAWKEANPSPRTPDESTFWIQKPERDWFTAHYEVLNNWENANFTADEKVAADNDNQTHYDVQALDWLPSFQALPV